MNTDEPDGLDLSWLVEEEKLQTIQQNFYREPNKTIRLQFIYINLDNDIDSVSTEEYNLSLSMDNKESVLSQEELLHILESKKRRTENTNYVISELLLYNVHLEHEHIQSFINYNGEELATNSKRFLKSISYVNSIQFSPSIFIFHDINTLFFIFKERRNRYVPYMPYMPHTPIQAPSKNIIKRTKKKEN